MEHTLSIIKPNAVKKSVTGKINALFETNGLKIIAMKMILIDKATAEEFYSVHKDRPFFNDLVSFMTSGPVIVQVLEGENAVQKNRDIMGNTDPAKAEEGTIRKLYGDSIEANSVHGSDSAENAKIEIDIFFNENEKFNFWLMNLLDHDLNSLNKYFLNIGESNFRATQVFKWIYKDLKMNFKEMTNISKKSRLHLEKEFEIKIPEVYSHNISKDGTVKLLMYDPNDINNKYETIYIPEKKKRDFMYFLPSRLRFDM